MTAAVPQRDWTSINQRLLMDEVAALKRRLQNDNGPIHAKFPSEERSALDILAETFRLSRFERTILLLCAAIELDSSIAALCGEVRYPTFSLALSVFPDAHWSAISAGAPLRRWRLIEVCAGPSLTQSPLKIDERILNFLTGLAQIDEQLTGYLEPLTPCPLMASSHRQLADRLAASTDGGTPVIHLHGPDAQANRDITAAVAEALGLVAFVLHPAALPSRRGELDTVLRLCEREAALSNIAILMPWDEEEPAEAARNEAVQAFLRGYRGALFLCTPQRIPKLPRKMRVVEVEKPGFAEQRELWQAALGDGLHFSDSVLNAAVAQFSLTAEAIESSSRQALMEPTDNVHEAVWKTCREAARTRLGTLAQRVVSGARWTDLVLPEVQMRSLRNITAQVRNRFTVYEEWGFAANSGRGLGISALFAGPSGTGKTLAAEVIANELQLDLFRVDLSQIVNKYIGETEKNLRRVFDAAEAGGAVLLFDEADAIFGKRGEVKDSHDRYANLEVSYLLQRMEAYRGLAILTTNLKNAIDPAFHRRLRFILQFPFPDAAQRAEIWRKAFPSGTPIENLAFEKIARLNLAGGAIRNMALTAAFLAAAAGEPVRMTHLAQAARAELSKLERPVPESELSDWS